MKVLDFSELSNTYGLSINTAKMSMVTAISRKSTAASTADYTNKPRDPNFVILNKKPDFF